MPSGGRRPGAGRPHIDATDPLTIYCASEFDKIVAFDSHLMQDLVKRSLKKHRPSDLPKYEDYQEKSAELSAVPANKRGALIAASGSKDTAAPATPLDDSRYIIDELSANSTFNPAPPSPPKPGENRLVDRIRVSVPISPPELGRIYKRIAAGAKIKFGESLTPRQVKRRIHAFWKAQDKGLFD
jgi:hypothetical protein